MTPPFDGRPDGPALAMSAVPDAVALGPPALGGTVAGRPAPRVVRTVPPPVAVLDPWLTPDGSRSASAAWRAAKRAFDIGFSLGSLLLALPLLAVLALAIWLESPGPVFYRTRRVGHRGGELLMLKFRKMHRDADGPPLTTRNDARFTRVGAFLTASRLDELPQLWDVLRGRMSVIGPRPEDPRFVVLHPVEYDEILTVRPGLLGLSQLAYQAERHILSPQDPVEDYVDRIMPQKLILDRLYARQTSLRLDLSILRWAIVAFALRRPVSVDRRTGAMNVRRPGPRRTTPGTTIARG